VKNKSEINTSLNMNSYNTNRLVDCDPFINETYEIVVGAMEKIINIEQRVINIENNYAKINSNLENILKVLNEQIMKDETGCTECKKRKLQTLIEQADCSECKKRKLQ
jgi:hypothetical protein